MAVQERTLTKDGNEMQFGTNHLGHFLLFQLVKPALLAAATPEFPSRVVNLSSVGHRMGQIQLDNLTLDNGAYNPWTAYGQAKTANIWMTNAITTKYSNQNLYGLAVHPGGIWTPLQRHLDQSAIDGWKENKEMMKTMKSPEQGAATTVLAALGADYKGKGRLYLEDSGVWGPAKGANPLELGSPGHAEWAFNEEGEEKLWKESAKLVGVPE
jgi:NAD(P)-dependent dehydrogenase (short-subunit alcohol dehydrogenase family)